MFCVIDQLNQQILWSNVCLFDVEILHIQVLV